MDVLGGSGFGAGVRSQESADGEFTDLLRRCGVVAEFEEGEGGGDEGQGAADGVEGGEAGVFGNFSGDGEHDDFGETGAEHDVDALDG